MSSGPALTGSTCIEVTKCGGYVNIDLSPELYCSYTGECKRNRLVFNRDEACLYCKYRRLLDVPAMIDKRLEENKQ